VDSQSWLSSSWLLSGFFDGTRTRLLPPPPLQLAPVVYNRNHTTSSSSSNTILGSTIRRCRSRCPPHRNTTPCRVASTIRPPLFLRNTSTRRYTSNPFNNQGCITSISSLNSINNHRLRPSRYMKHPQRSIETVTIRMVAVGSWDDNSDCVPVGVHGSWERELAFCFACSGGIDSGVCYFFHAPVANCISTIISFLYFNDIILGSYFPTFAGVRRTVVCSNVLGYKGIWGAVTQGKERPTFFPYTTRNAKILIIHYTAIILLRKPHRSISGGVFSLPTLS